MSWHFVERWLQKVNQHSTLIGKFWLTFLIIFRIVVVSSVGDRVYSDEQSEFKCNTLQVNYKILFKAFQRKNLRSVVQTYVSICSPQSRTFDFGHFKLFSCVHRQSYLWFIGTLLILINQVQLKLL